MKQVTDIITERLIIRPFRETDGEGLYQYLSDPDVVLFEPYEPFGREAAYAEAVRRAGDPQFLAVCLKNGDLIGNLYCAEEFCESREVGYVFNHTYWGHGYATEALSALMSMLFREMGVHRIFAMCSPRNPHSWRLLERVGMRREGELKQNIYFKHDASGAPIWMDTYIYAALCDEWLACKGKGDGTGT